MVPITVTDPEIIVGEEKVKFKVNMESGMYLELNSQEDCKLYGKKGEFLQNVKLVSKIPLIRNGENNISFKCQGTSGVSSRVQITIITQGNPIN